MNHIAKLLLIIIGLNSIQGDKSFPVRWERCKPNSSSDVKRNKCVERSMKNIIAELLNKGDDYLGLGTLSPFKMDQIVIGQDNPTSPVRLRLELKNIDLYGLKDVHIIRAVGRFGSAKDFYIRFETTLPKISFISDYKVDGNILIFPIVGQGRSNFTLDNVHTTSEMYGKSVIRNGKEYLKGYNDTLSLDIKRLYIRLENLFNGNRALGDNMNNVLNENSDVIWQELRPSVEAQLELHLFRYARKIFEVIEYNQLFNLN